MWFWRSNRSKRSSSRDLEKYDAYEYDPDDDKRRRRWSQVAVVILVAASIWLADRQGWLPKDPRRAGGRGGKAVVEAPRDGDQSGSSAQDSGDSTGDSASEAGKSGGSAESASVSDSSNSANSGDSESAASRRASSPSIGPASSDSDDAGSSKSKASKSSDGATDSDPDAGSSTLDAEATGGKAKASIGKASGAGTGAGSGKSGGATGGSSTSGKSTSGKSGSAIPITSLIKNVTIRDENDKVVFRGDVDLAETLARIDRGEKLSQYRHDGIEFQNREERLPKKPAGYYHEWVHPTPGLKGPGPQRVVTGKNGDAHYSHDHYQSFRQVR